MLSNNLSCCDDKQLVQDKICNDWTITTTEIIYIDNVSALVSSGYVKLNSAPAGGTITVNFLLGADVVAALPDIGVNSAAAFTVGKFDSIQIVPSAADETFIGEFCITPRYYI